MNRPLVIMTALAMCAGVIGAVQLNQNAVRSSAAENAPAYTVTLPAGISLGDTAVISAQDLNLQEGESVRVWLSGTGEEDNAFRLHSESHELTYSITQDGEPVDIGSQVFRADPGSDTQSAALQFSLPDGRPLPGTYLGTVEFTISAVDENRRSVAVPGVGYLNATAGETLVPVNFFNPEGNPCYFRYEIVLADTGETLWKSDDLLTPGMKISQIELAKPLDAGNYAAVLKVIPLSLDQQQELNSSEIGFELRVKEG